MPRKRKDADASRCDKDAARIIGVSRFGTRWPMRPAARSDASGATQSTIGLATRVRREQPASRIIFDRCRKSTSAVEKMAQLINAVAADQGVCRDYIAETQLRI